MKLNLLRQIKTMSKFTFYGLVLQLLFTGLILASDGLAQKQESIEDIFLSVNLDNATLEQVFKDVSKKTEFKFAFEHGRVHVKQRITIEANNESLADILRVVSESTNLKFRRVNQNIFVNKKDGSVVIEKEVIQPESLQGITINGRVTSTEDSDGLPGVNVVVKGSSLGTVTDISGNYSLVVPGTEAILVFSSVGFITEEQVVGNRAMIDLTMVPDVTALDDIVVTALGISREKNSLGYAVGQVKDEELNVVPQENVLGSLSSKVSGLDIRRSGNDLNAQTHVYIRGRTSLSGNDDPLVVVDGAPVGGPNVMADISALNVESVTVLKGASAAALYGSRAGNGVIIVTTKSGAGMKKGIGVSLNTSVTFNTPYRYIDLQNRFTNGQKGLFNESTWQHWYGAEEGTPAVQWNTDGQAEPLKFYQNSLKDYYRTGVSNINDVSVTGNYDKGSFRFSVTQMSGQGYTPGTELQKIGFGLATSYKITDKVTFSTNIDVYNPESDNLPLGAEGGNDEYFDIFNIAPHINVNDLKDNYWEVENVEQRRVGEGYNNPWFSANESKTKFNNIRGFGNAKLDWEIMPTLKAMARVSYSSNNNKQEILRPWSFDGFGGGTAKPQGAYNISNVNERETNIDVLLSYDKQFGDFSISPSVGGNIMNRNTSTIDAGGDNLVLPGLFTLSNVTRGGLNYNSGYFEKAIYSVYGMALIGYKNIAYLDLTARNDWSSTLPEANRSYFYPSASLSLFISEMLEMPSWISQLKLRTGYAQVGKDTDPYLINPTLTQGYWGDNFTYSLPSSKPNTNLKPEIATSYEVGADLGLFDGRLGFEATYYTTQNRNQIMNVPLSPLTGYTSTTINAGNVENSGVELGLNLIPIQTNNLVWNLNVNFTKQESKLVELVEGIDRVDFGGGTDAGAFTRVGGIIGDLYSPYVLKVEEGEYAGWNILDANGRWEVDRNRENQKKVGNFNNDFAMGLNTSVTYKSFTLSASFDWRQGGDFFSISMKRMARSGKIEDWQNGISSSTFSGILDANSFNGDRDQLANEIKTNPIYRDNDVWVGGRTEELGGFEFNGNYNGAFFPGVIDNGDGTYTENFGADGTKLFDAYRVVESSGSFWRTGYAFMYDASFVKMRDITLSYKLPKNISSAISAQNVSVSVFAKNIMLWTAADIGIDPETTYDGGQQGLEEWNIAPWTTPIGFRLNVEF